MQSDSLLQSSQETATGSYPGQNESREHTPTTFLQDSFQYYIITYVYVFLVVFLQIFLPKCCMHFCPTYATWPTHLITLDLTSLVLLYENILWRSLSCSFLQPPSVSSFLVPNIFMRTTFSNTPLSTFYLKERDKFQIHTWCWFWATETVVKYTIK
jgi:hypothetical protein